MKKSHRVICAYKMSRSESRERVKFMRKVESGKS